MKMPRECELFDKLVQANKKYKHPGERISKLGTARRLHLSRKYTLRYKNSDPMKIMGHAIYGLWFAERTKKQLKRSSDYMKRNIKFFKECIKICSLAVTRTKYSFATFELPEDILNVNHEPRIIIRSAEQLMAEGKIRFWGDLDDILEKPRNDFISKQFYKKTPDSPINVLRLFDKNRKHKLGLNEQELFNSLIGTLKQHFLYCDSQYKVEPIKSGYDNHGTYASIKNESLPNLGLGLL